MDRRGEKRGIAVTVTAVSGGNRLKCAEPCREKYACPLMKLCSRSKSEYLTLAALTIENRSGREFSPRAEAWELVDAQGFAVGGAAVCESLLPADHVPADQWSVSPGTRVRTMLAFPSMEAPAALLYGGEIRLRVDLMGGSVDDMLLRMGAERKKHGIDGKIRIRERWMLRDAAGKKQYIFIGEKK